MWVEEVEQIMGGEIWEVRRGLVVVIVVVLVAVGAGV